MRSIITLSQGDQGTVRFVLESATTQLSIYVPKRIGELENDSAYLRLEDVEASLAANATAVSPLEALDDWNFA